MRFLRPRTDSESEGRSDWDRLYSVDWALSRRQVLVAVVSVWLSLAMKESFLTFLERPEDAFSV